MGLYDSVDRGKPKPKRLTGPIALCCALFLLFGGLTYWACHYQFRFHAFISDLTDSTRDARSTETFRVTVNGSETDVSIDHVEFPEIFGFRIINVNTDIGPDPDQAIGIFVQYPDEIIPDRHRVGGIVFEYPEPVAVIPRQPVFRSQPNEPEMILQYAAHRILAQPVFHSDMGKVQIIGKRNLRRQMRTIKQYNE